MKIIAAIPLPYAENVGYWTRDLGLVVVALRQIGHEATFVALGDSARPTGEHPVKLISRATMANPAWWQAQHAEGIILNTWSATRYEDIRGAALSAGCPLIEKLDTNGVKSPRIWFWHYLRRNFVNYDRRHPLRQGIPAALRILAQAFVVYCFPAALDEPMVRSMSRVPLYAAETPVAAARVRRFLRLFHADPMPRVVTVHHPVNTADMGFDENHRKLNRVIAVGRWNDAVKGWPLLEAVARRFLRIQPDWTIQVAGSGAEEEGAALAAEFPGRFQMLGRLEHAQLSSHLRAARIFLLTSHSETFCIAAAEALCCGCSVVGPAQIPSSPFFASLNSGTPSYKRSPDHMVDALLAEVDEWQDGNRNPLEISRRWLEKVSVKGVSTRYVELFQQLLKIAPAHS